MGGGDKTQLTFGTHDDTAPKFLDANTIVFTSTATDPAVMLTPEVARNGTIPNVWSLDLKADELRQWTDTATGNVSPVLLPAGACDARRRSSRTTRARTAFTSSAARSRC